MFNLDFCSLVMVLMFVFAGGFVGAAIIEKPRIVRLYTMDNCGPCMSVKGKIESRGISTTPDYYVNNAPEADGFPTIIYSNGKRDNGLRIHMGMVDYSETSDITVIHYRP